MKPVVYIAASWRRKDEIKNDIRPVFERYGIRVNSRWLEEEAGPAAQLHELPFEYHQKASQDDLDDIQEADYLVLISNGYGSSSTGGGRFFEMGVACAMGKQIITIGERETVFQYLTPQQGFHQVETVHDAISIMLTQSMQDDWKLMRANERRRIVQREQLLAAGENKVAVF